MSFWENKKVVVTGGAGFVGSHLTELLLQAGARVTVIDNLSHGMNRIHGAQLVRANVEDQKSLLPLFNNIDVVFNLAAYVAGVIYNQNNQLEMFEKNVQLQVTPVKVASMQKVPYFLQTSSVCVYAPEYNHPAKEENGLLGEPVQANNAYSWSKRIGEMAVQWSDLPHAVVVRPSNIYGPRDYFDERAHVIPALIRKILNPDEPIIKLFGSGQEIREFIYVEDIAQGMLRAIEHGAHKQVYNIGSPTRISMKDLAQLIASIAGVEKEIEILGGNGGDPERWSDCTKATTAFNWQAETTLSEGLEKTIRWYRK